MHTSSVKVLRAPITFGGWKARLIIDGDTATVEGNGSGRSMVFSLAEVRRASYNSTNGLWAFRLQDGRRLWLQSAGSLLSADRTVDGKIANSLITERLAHHGVRMFGV